MLIPGAVVAASLFAVNRAESQTPDARPLAEVRAEVEAAADGLQRAAGNELLLRRDGPEPCEQSKMTTPRKAPWLYRGNGYLDQPGAVDKIRQWWVRSGFEGTGLTARDPATGIVVKLIPIPDSDRVAVHLTSACLSPADGEDPGYQGI